ncbi:hypothetical protein [Pseudomonas lini]|uniref:hypothetical protein n=1 Tax=Pseudomonas lini TaxID=163011 RepID=UPI0011E5A232|nr:hypothetical protein [Pseudomonas lini]
MKRYISAVLPVKRERPLDIPGEFQNEKIFATETEISSTTNDSLVLYSCARRGTISWSIEGNQSSKTVDTQGPFDWREFNFYGVTDAQCGGRTPYLPALSYVEELKGSKIILVEDWADGNDDSITYRLVFDTQIIGVSQAIGVAAGQKCVGGVFSSQGEMVIILSLRQRREAGKHILLYFQRIGAIWKDQEGGKGSFIINIFNGTNNQLLHSEPMVSPYRIALLLTDRFSTDFVPDGHEFRIEVRHDCRHKTETLGRYASAGASFNVCLAIESLRTEI